MDHYATLGVSEDATTDQIKAAFRKLAFDHHPDAQGSEASDSKVTFQKILAAYEVLRDPAKRAEYDLLRRSKPTPSGFPDSAADWGFRGPAGEDDWERAFDAWARRMQEEFGGYSGESEELKRERESAERIARAAAWEREKQEAALNKLRGQRIRQRAEDAKHARQAAVLRRYWQGRRGVTWQDIVVGVVFAACTAGAAYNIKQHARRHGLLGLAKDPDAEAEGAGETSQAPVVPLIARQPP